MALKFLNSGYFAGLVGIGMTPTNLLDLQATDNLSLRFYNSTSFKAGIQVATSIGDMIATSAIDDLAIRANTDANILFAAGGNAEIMRITSAGRVGIGTVSPSNTTHIYKNASLGSPISPTVANAGLRIQDSSNSMYFDGNAIVSVGAGNLEIGAATTSMLLITNGAERMRITSAGDVGIGTTSPDSLLNLEGAKNTSIITLGSTTNNSSWSVGDRFGGIDFYSGDGSGAGSGIKASISYEVEAGSTGSTNSMVFRASGTTAGTNNAEKMRISSGGDILINANSRLNGYTSSFKTLNISAESGDNASIIELAGNRNANAGNQNAMIQFWNKTSTATEVSRIASLQGSVVNSGDIQFSTSNAGTLSEKMRITSAGQLKLNTYGSGTYAGTVTKMLAVDANGNVIETTAGSGTVAGSGTANYVPKWTNSNTLTNGLIYDNGTNVGIGTTAPLYKLQVQDRIHIQDVTNFQPKISFSENTNSNGEFVLEYNGAGGGAGNYVSFYSEQSGWVSKGNGLNYIPSNGFVGIGTTSPAAKLSVAAPTAGDTTILVGRLNSKPSIKSDATEGGYLILDSHAGAVALNHYSSNNVWLATGGGNVGIGTTNPGATLDVRHDAGGTVRIGTDTDNIGEDAAFGTLEFYNGDTSNSGPGVTAMIQAKTYNQYSVGGDITFSNKIYPSSTITERMRITSSGNVGIGTDSPAAKLEVYSGTLNNQLYLVSPDTGQSGINFGGTTAKTKGRISYSDNSDAMSFNTASSERMRIISNGKVGIGTTSPQDALDIDWDTEGVATDRSGIRVRAYRPHLNLIDRSGYSTSNGHNFQIKADRAKLQFNATSADDETFDLTRMVIDKDGNVGIGTTSPGAKLNVAGDVLINASANSNSLKVYRGALQTLSLWNATNGAILSLSSDTVTNSISLDSRANQNSYINTGGNVGIGTTSPNDKLDVTDGNSKMVFGGASSDRPLLYFQHNAVPVDGEEVGLLDFRGYNDASQDTRYVILTAKAEDVTDGSEDGSLTFSTMKAGTATSTLNLRSGNVGIGTTSPNSKFQIKVLGTDGIPVTNADTGTISFGSVSSTATASILGRQTASTTGLWIGAATNNANGAGDMEFNVRENNNSTFSTLTNSAFKFSHYSTSLLTILRNGNVGIGTTSPSNALDVIGNTSISKGVKAGEGFF